MPSVALRFAFRELRHGPRALRGFGVFLGCLALGVAAIAGVQSTASSIVTGLRADGREILGGDIALRAVYQDLAPADRTRLEQAAEAITHFAEMRTMARRPGAETSVLVELKAVDGRYPLFGRVETRGGDGAPVPLAAALAQAGGGWGALVDPALAERLELGEGDSLVIGGITLEVRGTIEREPDRAGSGGPFGFWPRVLVSLDALAASELVREGSLVYHQYAVRLAQGARLDEVRAEIGEKLEESGWRMRTYEDAAPGIQRMVERLGSFLSLVGLTALLVGGVGVSNAVRAWLDRRLGVIATLKCIGASRSIVFSTYLSQLMVIAGLGVLAGLAAGALAPVAVSRLLEGLLPVPVALGVYPGVLGLAVLFGLITAVTFTVWPLSRAHETPAVVLFRGRGSRRSSRATGASRRGPRGRGGACRSRRGECARPVVRGVVHRRGGADPGRLSRRRMGGDAGGTRRAPIRPARSGDESHARSVSARRDKHCNRIACADRTAVFTARMARTAPADGGFEPLPAGQRNGGRRAVARPRPHRAGRGRAGGRKPAARHRGLPPRGRPRLLLRGRRGGPDRASCRDPGRYRWSRPVSVGAVPARAHRAGERPRPPAGDGGRRARVAHPGRSRTQLRRPVPPDSSGVAGDWWPEDYTGPPLLSVDVDVIDAFDLELGDTITLNVLGREITAEVRHVRRVEWQGMQLNFALLLSPEPLRRAPHSYVATVSATPEAEVRIERLLAREFPQVTVVRVREALGRVAELMGSIATAARAVGAITLLSGALVLAGAVAAGHQRRTYESVVLKVLGVRRRDVALIHAAEFALLGLVTGVIAAAAGTVTAWGVTTRVLEQEWVFLPGAVASTVGFCILLTLGFGLFGTWRALGEPASPYLRNE